MRTCLNCSSNIEHKRADAKCCSQACKDAIRYKQKEWSYEKQEHCLICNCKIENKFRNAKYCSKKCKDSQYSKEKSKRHYLNNKEYYYSKSTLRSRGVKQAMPKWANKQDIRDVYLEAQYMQMHVDHIIPLKHPLVCGLHVWDNLQLLTPKQNLEKGNKFVIE